MALSTLKAGLGKDRRSVFTCLNKTGITAPLLSIASSNATVCPAYKFYILSPNQNLMKTKLLLSFAVLVLLMVGTAGCKKDELAENKKNIKKLWKLEQYLVNGVDKTGSLLISSYDESYTDNQKYDRSYTDKNGNKQVQNGSFEFESANRLHVSGVGSIEFTNGGTASSSYYDIIRLTETQLWYSYTNGSNKHEFHLSRK
jgi:hypothetical protein